MEKGGLAPAPPFFQLRAYWMLSAKSSTTKEVW